MTVNACYAAAATRLVYLPALLVSQWERESRLGDRRKALANGLAATWQPLRVATTCRVNDVCLHEVAATVPSSFE